MSSRLAKQGYEVTVLDITENALKTARSNFIKNKTNGEFVKADIFKMPFESETFDIVWNQGVIEHFDDIKGPILTKLIEETNELDCVCITLSGRFNRNEYKNVYSTF